MNELSLFNSLFDDVFGNANSGINYYAAVSSPRVDVKEEDNSYVLEMELPGKTEKDVNIHLDSDTLTIASVKEDKKEEKKETKKSKYILRERSCMNFERRFTIPNDVDKESIAANFKNGVLTVSMTKKAIAAPRQIAIQAC
ncbi:MAG: Hsp20/alpha crystallin family protein [Treponema sp.]|nr:Hsp20/alpha crystallin family protein [Treponema sp.]